MLRAALLVLISIGRMCIAIDLGQGGYVKASHFDLPKHAQDRTQYYHRETTITSNAGTIGVRRNKTASATFNTYSLTNVYVRIKFMNTFNMNTTCAETKICVIYLHCIYYVFMHE